MTPFDEIDTQHAEPDKQPDIQPEEHPESDEPAQTETAGQTGPSPETHAGDPTADRSEATGPAEPLPDLEGNKGKWTPRKLLRRSVFIGIAVYAILALFFYLIVNMTPLKDWMSKFLYIFSPLIWGLVLAYLLNPAYNVISKHILKKMQNRFWKRFLTVFLTFVWFFAIVWLIGWLIVPNTISSLSSIINNLDIYIDNMVGWLNNAFNWFARNFLHSDTIKEYVTVEDIRNAFGGLFNETENFFNSILETLSHYRSEIINSGSSILAGAFNIARNILFGFFISLYILASKDKRLAQAKKFKSAILSDKMNRTVDETLVLFNRSFGGFINGKLLDSLIIGVLSAVVLGILRMPYPVLLGTIIGVTNIIPVIGPFIGAIPCALLILMINPSKVFLFILVIFIIQQIDGNIIGPRILGSSVGISSLAIIIAVLIMGSIFGVIGALISVPLFAILITLIRKFLEKRLAAKGMSCDTASYYPEDSLANPLTDGEIRTDKTKQWFAKQARLYETKVQIKQLNGKEINSWDRFSLKFLNLMAGNQPFRKGSKNNPPAPKETPDSPGSPTRTEDKPKEKKPSILNLRERMDKRARTYQKNRRKNRSGSSGKGKNSKK